MLIHELYGVLTAATGPTLQDAAVSSRWWAQPLATLIAGSIVGLGAWLGFIASSDNRRSMEYTAFMVDRRERKKAERDHDREKLSDQQSRFTKIAEQLADAKEPVRLAGMYGLSALADEWHQDGRLDLVDVAIELICAYLRTDSAIGDDKEVRAAAISVIKEHTQKDSDPKWPGDRINLSRAELSMADLEGCELSGASLDETVLDWANLSRANLSSTWLRGTVLISANLSYTNMASSYFLGCQFRGANLVESELQESTFRPWVNIIGGQFKIIDCDLRGTVFINADLRGADLRAATLGLVDGDPETVFATSSAEEVDGGKWENVPYKPKHNTETKWPPDFDIKKVIERQLEAN
jgi:hypothetical protein